jgi:hypothetical protein
VGANASQVGGRVENGSDAHSQAPTCPATDSQIWMSK